MLAVLVSCSCPCSGPVLSLSVLVFVWCLSCRAYPSCFSCLALCCFLCVLYVCFLLAVAVCPVRLSSVPVLILSCLSYLLSLSSCLCLCLSCCFCFWSFCQVPSVFCFLGSVLCLVLLSLSCSYCLYYFSVCVFAVSGRALLCLCLSVLLVVAVCPSLSSLSTCVLYPVPVSVLS